MIRVNSLWYCLIFFVPMIHFTADANVRKEKFGSYVVVIDYDRSRETATLKVNHNGKSVFEENEIGSRYFLGNKFESVSKQGRYKISDLTGDGIDDLIISKSTGGAHCCNYIYVFELGHHFRQIAAVDAKSNDIRIVDLDKDGRSEIEFWDGSIDYLFASFSGSPSGRVVLKHVDGEFRVYPPLMRKSSLSDRILIQKRSKIRDAFKNRTSPDLPYDFLELVLDLSYSGHFETAMNLTDELWPPGKPGLAKFKTDFQAALNSSPYWTAFVSSGKH